MNITKEQADKAKEIYNEISKLECEMHRGEELKANKYKVMAVMEPSLLSDDLLDIYIMNAKSAIIKKQLELEAL